MPAPNDAPRNAKAHCELNLRHTMIPCAMPDTPAIETREEVMFFDTDIGGVVHNLAYLRMIETARTRLAARLGLQLREMASTQLYPVVLRTEIDYRKPATLGDELIVRGRLESVERARFWCAFEMIRAADEMLLITCRQSLAMVQMPQGRPQRLPEDWFARYAHLLLKRGKQPSTSAAP